MRKIVFILLSIACLPTFGQEAAQKHKIGVKTSFNISTLLGTEFDNPRPKFGYTAGVFYHRNKENTWGFYNEFSASFRGSTFSNGDTGYSKIALFYVDAAVLPTRMINQGANSISIGPYTSYLALSSLYIRSSKKTERTDLNFKDMDFGLAAYYHTYGPIVSFQIGAKLSLIDANNGVNFDGVFPATGNNGWIRNLSLEIGMLF